MTFDQVKDHRKDHSYRWNVPKGVLGMGTADLDFDCPPCVREATLQVAEENCFNYRQLPDRYYSALQHWYDREYDLPMRQEWFSNVPGTIGAVRIAMSLLAGEGDWVIVQTPCFGPLSRSIEGAGCRQLDNPMMIKDGRYVLDLVDFEEKLKAYHPSVFLLVNPHNPTCRVFTEEELSSLTGLCAKYDVAIISDEVHSLLIYDGNRHIPLLSMKETEKLPAVQVLSLSKGYNLMSLPHAIVAIRDRRLRENWKAQIQSYSFSYAVNSFAVAAVTSVLEGKAETWRKNLLNYLQTNRDMLLEFFNRGNLPCKAYKPESSFLLWADFSLLGVKNLAQYFLSETRISLNDGQEFGPEGEGFIRLNFAVTKAVLREAMKRLEGLVQGGKA